MPTQRTLAPFKTFNGTSLSVIPVRHSSTSPQARSTNWDTWYAHERYFHAIRDFRNNGTLREEVEQSLADCVGKRRDEQNERDHLGREEEESEGIAVDTDGQRTTSLILTWARII